MIEQTPPNKSVAAARVKAFTGQDNSITAYRLSYYDGPLRSSFGGLLASYEYHKTPEGLKLWNRWEEEL